ncbi:MULTISPECIES: hypothetical protein [unclassified Mesorhizobium]|uniref:hypothetical protein n=1 Tax=unclassified Mesorhizobium TaxID=325217 RepID=UPI001675BACD|nr:MULTISPECIES: hypothetical protein [unclassified Mesorhizobium]
MRLDDAVQVAPAPDRLSDHGKAFANIVRDRLLVEQRLGNGASLRQFLGRLVLLAGTEDETHDPS